MNNHTMGIGLGILMFISGLALHVFSRTNQVPPERKKLMTLSAITLMIVGATMAMLPYMMKLAQQSPP